MKRPIKNLLSSTLLVALVIGLSSCGGSKGSTSSAPDGEKEIEILCSGPEYFTNSEYFRANAVGESMDQATSKKKAYSNAKADLASYIQTTIKAVTDNYLNSREFNNKEELEERFEGLNREVVNQELNGIQTTCERMTQAANGNYKTYVAIQLSGSDLMEAMNRGISQDERLKIDYDYEKFKETFNEEMENFK